MTVDREQFLTVDFKLPNHSNELSKAEEIIEKLKLKVEQHAANNTIDDKLHDFLYNELVRVLDYVGRLSMPAFAIEDELEQMYIIKFKNAPELAKKLWLDHYEDIHHPYTLLKNRCFRLLELLDESYYEKFKKNPPNWKI
jgi:hypothetical protein